MDAETTSAVSQAAAIGEDADPVVGVTILGLQSGSTVTIQFEGSSDGSNWTPFGEGAVIESSGFQAIEPGDQAAFPFLRLAVISGGDPIPDPAFVSADLHFGKSE
ncbi:MAG: hypothetical protein AB7O97_02325 [Planctomycetota bacterium]